MNKQKNNKNLSKNLFLIGGAAAVLSPVVYLVLPQFDFFSNLVCGEGCGYAGSGMNGYALIVGLGVLSIGVVSILVGLFLKNRR